MSSKDQPGRVIYYDVVARAENNPHLNKHACIIRGVASNAALALADFDLRRRGVHYCSLFTRNIVFSREISILWFKLMQTLSKIYVLVLFPLQEMLNRLDAAVSVTVRFISLPSNPSRSFDMLIWILSPL
jgi:hypothetical protein